ncbi:hypothetical protein Y032_0007g3250 [Ancylostoma ceylanicum]|uniref:Uncharacterized protein n=1 Tax=Ancylostoma ceylanicum TaxID=53326 RepID=A0A016VN98_9BILA|nr:hypothetical protein Y032_0007g3250 [Ancylostoma ceylanicum]
MKSNPWRIHMTGLINANHFILYQSGRPADAGLPDFPYARFARMTSPRIHLSRVRIMPIFAPFPLNALPHENGLTKENYLRLSE